VRHRLAVLCGKQVFIAQAPVDLLFCMDWRRIRRWTELEVAPFTAVSSFKHFWVSIQDTVMCAQNICTAADALGLGSVYVGSVMECLRDLRRLRHLPERVFPVVLLCIGYPKSRPVRSKKLGPGIIVHEGVYRDLGDEEILKAYDAKYSPSAIEPTPERLDLVRRQNWVLTEIRAARQAAACGLRKLQRM
jgi:FMN reductase [NAD(P)H]